jgi:hypothetical protein
MRKGQRPFEANGGFNVQEPCYDHRFARDHVPGVAHIRSRASRVVSQRAFEV